MRVLLNHTTCKLAHLARFKMTNLFLAKLFILILWLVGCAWAQLPTVLEVRGALPCAGTGFARTACLTGYVRGVARLNEPVTVGVPFADSDAIAGIADLRLQNSSGTQLP